MVSALEIVRTVGEKTVRTIESRVERDGRRKEIVRTVGEKTVRTIE